MKRGHIPVRQCIACRKRRPQMELIRLKACGVKVTLVSRGESVPGRGCYICPQPECIKIALKKGRMQRALDRSGLVLPTDDQLLAGHEQKR